MMFYNGFNMLIDMLLALVVYRLAYRAGYIRGYGEGENDYKDHMEKYADYAYETRREDN